MNTGTGLLRRVVMCFSPSRGLPLLTDGLWAKEQVTYVAGEWNTFNNAIKIVESFYGIPTSQFILFSTRLEIDLLCLPTGRPMPRIYKSRALIEESLAKHVADGDFAALELAQVEELMIMGCLNCPKDKTLRQRAKYFGKVEFLDLENMLMLAEKQRSV